MKILASFILATLLLIKSDKTIQEPKKVYIQSVENKIQIGSLSKNRNLTFGFKNILLDEYTKPNKNNSIIIYSLLYILKLFYYQIPLINRQTYVELKRYIMNELITKKESVYYVLT